jgi:hypothetical protein
LIHLLAELFVFVLIHIRNDLFDMGEGFFGVEFSGGLLLEGLLPVLVLWNNSVVLACSL